MKAPSTPKNSRFNLNEDWLALILAFGIILLSTLGLLGEGGILIPF